MPTKEYKVPATTGNGVVIVRGDETKVTVQWLCGGQFVFTKEGARTALENFERVNLVPDLTWRDAPDLERGNPFYARLVGKQFQADSSIFETATGVPWDKFRAALVKAIGPAKKTTEKKPRAKKKL